MRKRTKSTNKKKIILPIIIILIIIVGLVLYCNTNKESSLSRFFQETYEKLSLRSISMTYSNQARQKLNFNYGWQFSKGQGKNNANSDLAEQAVSIIPNTYKDSLFARKLCKRNKW